MIQTELHRILLAGMLLVATPQLILAGSYRIETLPPEQGVCLYCKTTEACQSYAAGSICHRGQCTNENGLFGVGCGCNAASECASGRCEGMFESTCQDKLKNGEVCFGGVDCISGRCNSMLFCEPSMGSGEVLPGGEKLPPEIAAEIAPQLPAAGMHGSSMHTTTTTNNNNNNPTSATTTGHHHHHDVGALLAGDKEPEFKACTACADDSECGGGGGGSCLEGFCADSSGEHPPTCITCRTDDDCIGGYYCYSNMNLNRSGKKCAVKRVNGASCTRNEACKSGHCNVLFQCESKLPSHKRPSTDPTSTSHEEQDRSFRGGILIWTSIIVAFMMLGVCAGLFCQRDRCCQGRRRRFDSEESHTCEFHDEHDHDHDNHDEHHNTTGEDYHIERPQLS